MEQEGRGDQSEISDSKDEVGEGGVTESELEGVSSGGALGEEDGEQEGEGKGEGDGEGEGEGDGEGEKEGEREVEAGESTEVEGNEEGTKPDNDM